MSSFLRRGVVAFLSIASCVFAEPQPAPPPLSETLDVTIVNVEVFVTDRRGRRVQGLTRDDFEIRENGELQPITNFSEYRGAAPSHGTVGVDAKRATAAPAAAAEPAPVKRTIVLFVEDFRLPPFRTKPMFGALRETLRRIVRPGDEAAIYSWSWGLALRREFTDDVDALSETLASIEKEAGRVGLDDPARIREQIQDFEAAYYDSLGGGAFGDLSGLATAAGSQVFAPGIDRAIRERAKIRRQRKDLETLIQLMGAEEGKKILILSTTRFGQYAGAAYFQNGTVPEDFRSVLDTTPEQEALTRTANTYGVTIYPVYPPGLQWTTAPSVTQGPRSDLFAVPEAHLGSAARDNNILANETQTLDRLAKDTGGLLAWGSQDIIKLLPRIEDDLTSYYSLGYRATPGTKQGRIEVTTKERGYTVRARRQVVVRDELTKLSDDLVANLFRPDVDAAIPIEVRFGKPEQDGRFFNLPLQLRFPVDAFTVLPQDGRMAGEFSVHFVTSTSYGVSSRVEHRNQRFQLNDGDTEAPPGAVYTYDVTLRVQARPGHISIAVVDEISKERGMILVELPPLR